MFVFLLFVGLLIFLLFICRGSLCILDMTTLSDTRIKDILLIFTYLGYDVGCINIYSCFIVLMNEPLLTSFSLVYFVIVIIVIAFFWLPFTWHTFSHYSTLSLCVSSKLKWVYCHQHVVRSCFFHPFSHLIGELCLYLKQLLIVRTYYCHFVVFWLFCGATVLCFLSCCLPLRFEEFSSGMLWLLYRNLLYIYYSFFPLWLPCGLHKICYICNLLF